MPKTRGSIVDAVREASMFLSTFGAVGFLPQTPSNDGILRYSLQFSLAFFAVFLVMLEYLKITQEADIFFLPKDANSTYSP